jgi:uncharacterized protein YdaU (DUF1376 family)
LENEQSEEPVPAKRKVEAKLVQNNKKQRVDLGDTYFVDKLVELEEKRIMDQTKLERERMEHERKAREDQFAFQREMLAMMQQQFQSGMQQQKHPPFNQSIL